jgi:xanthine dehydrogenase YagT iron-sulfur-binding subunit
VNSCLVLAVTWAGRDVATVEGLSSAGRLHPVQQAFIDRDALQCGYCTPGQLVSAVGMLSEIRSGWPSAVTETGGGLDAAEVRERMSGNICRCGAYANIVAAILEVGE